MRAIDSQGAVRGSEHFDMNIRIRPESQATLVSTGFRVISKIDLPPGKYSLRIGARESGRGALGTVFTDIEVPNLATPPLAMSNLIVTSESGRGVPTGRADQLDGGLPILPSTARAFRSTDELLIFAEVYDNEHVRPHAINLVATVLTDDRSQTVIRHQEQHSTVELAANGGRLNFAARIPLKNIKLGGYTLRYEATSSVGAEIAVAREMQIRVQSE